MTSPVGRSGRRWVLRIILDLKLIIFDVIMIITKTTLISIDLFVILNNFRTEQVNEKVIEWLNVCEKSRGTSANCVSFHCVCVICFDAFYIICASDGISQDFYPNREQDTREGGQRTALPDSPSQRWFPHNIRAIMAKIKFLKISHSTVIFWIKARRSYQDLSSQADPARENWTWSYTYFT